MPPLRGTDTGTLPNLIIIGAMKGGTTSLHSYLGLHPEISMSREKELNFFIDDVAWDRGIELYPSNWRRGIDWYRSNFAGTAMIHGEASPNYTGYPVESGVPGKMHSVIPDAKLIYVLRDPIDRMLSHYQHNCAEGVEDRPLDEALADMANPYYYRSRYFMQLEQFLAYYSPRSILIITQENLLRRRGETLREVFRFLEVDDSFQSPRFAVTRHKTRDKRKLTRIGRQLMGLSGMTTLSRIAPDLQWHIARWLCYPFSERPKQPVLEMSLRRHITDYLHNDVSRLRSYSGCNFADWSV